MLMEGTFSVKRQVIIIWSQISKLIAGACCGNFLRGKNLESRNAWDLEKNKK